MSNDSLIESIKSAIADGNHEEARTLLRVALKDPTAEIYYLASQVALNEQQRQSFLNKASSLESRNSAVEMNRVDIDTAPTKPRLKVGSQQALLERPDKQEINWLTVATISIVSLLGGILDGPIGDSVILLLIAFVLLIVFAGYAKNHNKVQKTQIWLDAWAFCAFYFIARYTITLWEDLISVFIFGFILPIIGILLSIR
jgi:hypothetical protein